jgi:hypothetical protein
LEEYDTQPISLRSVEMRNRHPEVRVVDAGPLPAQNREILKELLKKVALRMLKQMRYEAQREAS